MQVNTQMNVVNTSKHIQIYIQNLFQTISRD